MSCLQVEITMLPRVLLGDIITNIIPLSPIIQIGKREGDIQVLIEELTQGLELSVQDVCNHIKVSCGIFCSVSEVRYLQVSPNEVQWITPDEAIVYMVESNTNWTIITS